MTDVVVGDVVFGNGTATLAEFAVLSKWVKKPEGLSFDEAAGWPIPVETSLRILKEVGIEPGQTLVVSGAAGGVGSAVLQFARDRGITVIGTASVGNHDYLRSLGAVATTYGDGLVDRVRELAPQGVDAALDISGSGVLPDLIELTGDPAKVLTIADFGAGEFGAKISTSADDHVASYQQAVRLYEAGGFTLPVTRSFPLEKSSDAHAASQTGHGYGRVIVTLD